MVVLEALSMYIGFKFIKKLKENLKNSIKKEKNDYFKTENNIKDLRWSGAIDLISEKNDIYKIFNNQKKQ